MTGIDITYILTELNERLGQVKGDLYDYDWKSVKLLEAFDNYSTEQNH